MKQLLAIAVSTALGLTATAAHAAEVTWRVPTSVPAGSPFYVNFLERFAGHVEDFTSGRVDVQPFGAGVIVPALQVYDAVKEGTVEAGHSTPSYLVNQNPTNAIFAGFPGGMGPNAYLSWIYEAGGLERLRELRAEEGLYSLVVGIGSTEILAHSNVEIRGPEDLEGLKFRTSGPWAEVMSQYYGAVPTVVPAGEIYTLLQRRGVDAVEWAPPSANLPEGFHQAARYIVIPGVHQPTFLWEVVLQEERWNALDDDLKVLIEGAARLTTYESLTHFYHADREAMETYRSGRNEIISLDPEFVEDLAESGRDWAMTKANAEADAGRGDMLEILEDYFAYRTLWLDQADYLIE